MFRRKPKTPKYVPFHERNAMLNNLWSPSSGHDYSLVEDLENLYARLLPDPETNPHKCSGCGSTEHTGSRCSYCRQLVAA